MMTSLGIGDGFLLKDNIIGILKKRSEKFPDNAALMIKKDNSSWSMVTYKEYYDNVLLFANRLKVWLGKKANVGIFGFNSPAWFYSHLGCMLNGGFSVGIFPNATVDMCKLILDKINIEILVIENGQQLSVVSKLPNISNIKLILYYSPIDPSYDNIMKDFKIPVVSFGSFMESSINKQPIENMNSDDILTATIVFTSGTCDQPKPVSISHSNIVNAVNYFIRSFSQTPFGKIISVGQRYLSYLPLNFINSQLMDIYLPISLAGTVFFADRNVMKNSLAKTLKEVKPNLFFGIPSSWQKLKENIESTLNSTYIYGKLPKTLIATKILSDTGLNNCHLALTGTRPILNELKNFFSDLGLPICEFYGLTETTGPITFRIPGISNDASVGKVSDPCRLKINTDGEILIKGPTVVKHSGWFRSGDFGHIENGDLYISYCQGEKIITTEGEIIIASQIEQNIMKFIPFEHVMVIGHGKKFVSVLIIPKLLNGKIHPQYKLIDPDINKIKDLENSKKLFDKIVGLSSGVIKRVVMIDHEFRIGKELTPSLGLRRKYIFDKFNRKIERIYSDKKQLK